MVQIENKFNMGELVYFLNNKKRAQKGIVNGISVFMHKDGSYSIYYSIDGVTETVIEPDIFPSYEALMDWIKQDIIEFL